MADRSVATTDTLETFRTTYNSTAADVGDITAVTGASGIIASATDIVEAVTLMNTEVTAIKAGTAVFETKLTFEGSTVDDNETVLAITDPTADRTISIPDASGIIVTTTATQQLENKTLNQPIITSGVFNVQFTGDAFLDEDNMNSNSDTKLASQQSIKAYIDAQTTLQDLDIAPDSGTGQSIDLDSATLTFAGGTEVGTSASGTTVTLATTSNVVTLTGSQTLSNKTFTAPNLSTFTFTGTNSGLNIGGGGIVFEGSSDDAHETTLIAKEPGQDATITIPDADMTAITTATHATQASHIVNVIALG